MVQLTRTSKATEKTGGSSFLFHQTSYSKTKEQKQIKKSKSNLATLLW